jgi:hypothetical protein
MVNYVSFLPFIAPFLTYSSCSPYEGGCPSPSSGKEKGYDSISLVQVLEHKMICSSLHEGVSEKSCWRSFRSRTRKFTHRAQNLFLLLFLKLENSVNLLVITILSQDRLRAYFTRYSFLLHEFIFVIKYCF